MAAYDPLWVIYIGGTAQKNLHIQSRNSSNVLADVDITGATFTCKLRNKLDSGTVIATPTGSIDTASEGKMNIKIEEATTANLTEGSGVWDLWMTLNSDVTLVASGKYVIKQRVAR